MYSIKNAGKCLVYSKCGCIPGGCAEKLYQKLLVIHSYKAESTWEYLKDKLGLNKKDKRDVNQEINSTYLEHDLIEIPTQDANDEMWKTRCKRRPGNDHD